MALHDSHTGEEPLFAELSLLQPALPAQQETLKQNSLARTGLEGPELCSGPEPQGGSWLQK